MVLENVLSSKKYLRYFKVVNGNIVQKTFAVLFICGTILIVYQCVFLSGYLQNENDNLITFSETKSNIFNDCVYLGHRMTVQAYYDKRKDWVTSELGAMLFKNELSRTPRNKTFVILIWKYWNWLKNRHLFNFRYKRHRDDPLEECSVQNCVFTGNESLIRSADAVVIHIQHGFIPIDKGRSPNQRWIFLTDESPKNTFSMAAVKPNMNDWVGVFNWSMTYRSDADIPVPYGRTVPLKSPLFPIVSSEGIAKHVPHWKEKQRDVLLTILISNCGVPERMEYLNKLQEHINVDVYGKCSKDNRNSCPGHFMSDCPAMSNYLFYLVFENARCRQYLTEKSFHNAFLKGAIPVIMGPPLEDCEKLLPPNSFIHVENYETPEDLAKDIRRISRNNESLLMYHRWRNNFGVTNEHGYLGSKSYHFCRICEALNYNSDLPFSYQLNDLELFLNPKLLCE